MKLNKLTIQVPGQSSLKSGDNVVVDNVVVEGFVERGRLGGGRVLILFVDRVLSQQTEPLLHVDVLGISTEGLSQKAAIIYSKQNPGHLGYGD